MTRPHFGALAAALALTITAPLVTGAIAGPPWISIEYPVNPYDATTKDAYLVVHAFHHGTPTAFPVSGTAEGLVDGRRRTVALQFNRTSREGVYALRKQWPDEGVWTLVIGVMQAPEDRVSAIVDLGADGQVARVSVPTRHDKGWVLPAKVAMADVEAGLKARARQ